MALAAKKQISESLVRLEDGTWIGRYGEFTLKSAYQPIFRFAEGKLRPVAFECLLRPFNDDTPVLTGAFFKTLAKEDIGLIETLTRTLHIRNAVHLPRVARQLYINFDPAALSSKSHFESLLDDLRLEMTAVELAPSNCVCEITENAAESDDDLKYFVYALRARGYQVAVDDFGADSSDMKRITALTPDIVKLDGPMVKKLMNSPEGLAQLKTLLAKFKDLRINTIVEGLEEMWQIEMAQSAGADMVQGFAAAVPRTLPNNFSEWFEDAEALHFKTMPRKPASA